MFEGGEGSGKTTQAERLAASLGAVLTREPGGTTAGERIRSLLLDPSLPPVTERTEVLLMLAARAQHVTDVIEPALVTGRDVVCDRFSGSTLAYQGYGRRLDVEELRRLSSWASAGTEPDLVLLLRVTPAVAVARLGQRGTSDRMEGEGTEFFARVAAGFEALAEADRDHWRVVDADGPVDDVSTLVAALVADFSGDPHP